MCCHPGSFFKETTGLEHRQRRRKDGSMSVNFKFRASPNYHSHVGVAAFFQQLEHPLGPKLCNREWRMIGNSSPSSSTWPRQCSSVHKPFQIDRSPSYNNREITNYETDDHADVHYSWKAPICKSCGQLSLYTSFWTMIYISTKRIISSGYTKHSTKLAAWDDNDLWTISKLGN